MWQWQGNGATDDGDAAAEEKTVTCTACGYLWGNISETATAFDAAVQPPADEPTTWAATKQLHTLWTALDVLHCSGSSATQSVSMRDTADRLGSNASLHGSSNSGGSSGGGGGGGCSHELNEPQNERTRDTHTRTAQQGRAGTAPPKSYRDEKVAKACAIVWVLVSNEADILSQKLQQRLVADEAVVWGAAKSLHILWSALGIIGCTGLDQAARDQTPVDLQSFGLYEGWKPKHNTASQVLKSAVGDMPDTGLFRRVPQEPGQQLKAVRQSIRPNDTALRWQEYILDASKARARHTEAGLVCSLGGAAIAEDCQVAAQSGQPAVAQFAAHQSDHLTGAMHFDSGLPGTLHTPAADSIVGQCANASIHGQRIWWRSTSGFQPTANPSAVLTSRFGILIDDMTVVRELMHTYNIQGPFNCEIHLQR